MTSISFFFPLVPESDKLSSSLPCFLDDSLFFFFPLSRAILRQRFTFFFFIFGKASTISAQIHRPAFSPSSLPAVLKSFPPPPFGFPFPAHHSSLATMIPGFFYILFAYLMRLSPFCTLDKVPISPFSTPPPFHSKFSIRMNRLSPIKAKH